jgi:hypothetical protein
MNEISLVQLNDHDADKALEAMFGGESEYTSAVESFFGFESAYLNDGILPSIGRAFRNATTFKDTTKLRNMMDDIRNMSIDKISQTPSNVQISYEYFQKLVNLAKSRIKNYPEIEKLTKELLKEYDLFSRDDKMLDVLGAAVEGNIGSVKTILITGIGAIGSLAATGKLMSLAFAPSTTPIGGAIFGMTAGMSAYAFGVCVALFALALMTKFGENPTENTSVKANMDECKKRLKSLADKGLTIVKKLAGVNPQSKNVTQDLETLAERQGVFSINQFIKQTKVRQSVSYEQKVKIVTELKELSKNEEAVKNALQTSDFKKMFTDFNSIIKGFKRCGLDFSELEQQVSNSVEILKYIVLVNDTMVQALQQVLTDAKKY